MTNAADIFDTQAEAYDAARRRLIPPFDAFYGTAVAAVPAKAKTVLDLGAGTGLLSRMVRAARPNAHLTLLDGAPAMLDQARAELGDDRTAYVTADLTDPLPGEPASFCAVVSALAIHHLDDAGKRDLFARVHAQLKPGGAFVNAEQVAGPTPHLDALYRAWHEAQARAAGSDDAEWDAAEERMRFDRCATVEDQLGWLRDAGFSDVDCRFQDHRFAVLVARKG
ncbi:MAG TPA: class I SAM-dependent methyltransferase [Solirubrobacteraceae bacterium]|nr:class I SAM-dependent methyltransferase [Solirubrobacteraceae bacterium]